MIIAFVLVIALSFYQSFYNTGKNESASITNTKVNAQLNTNNNNNIISTTASGQGIEGSVYVIAGALAPGETIASTSLGKNLPLDVRLRNANGSSGRIIKVFISDDNGRFKVSLPIGSYCITLQSEMCSQNVEVNENEWARVNITIAAS